MSDDPGPSKYDDLARVLTERLDADAVVVVVLNGPYGHGACRAERAMPRGGTREQMRGHLIDRLRCLADSIERDDTPGRVEPWVVPS